MVRIPGSRTGTVVHRVLRDDDGGVVTRGDACRANNPTITKGERPVPGDGSPAAGAGDLHPGAARAGGAAPAEARRAPRISERCAWQVVEGEAVLLDLLGKRLAGLNPTGSFVFPLLDGVRTEEELAAAVADRFSVGREQAAADLRVFLADLTRRGFVEGAAP